LLSIIIAIRNVCRIIIWKDLNWKMCKKDAYDCGKGPVNTVFDLKITVFLLTVMYKVILQLLWNICINELIYIVHSKKWNLYIRYSMWTKVIPFPPSSLYISYKTIYVHNILMKSFLI
jgi:hypothetical protein